MTLHIDSLAYTNRLRRLAPEQKLLFALALLIITAFAQPLVQLLIALWISIWTVFYARIPVSIYLRLIVIASIFLLTSLPALLFNIIHESDIHLTVNDTIIGGHLGSYYIYLSGKGMEKVVQILSRSLASLACLYFLMLTIPFTEMLQTLRRCGCPALMMEILLLMYRFIFVLYQTSVELWAAQQSRNGYRSFRVGIKSASLLVGQLFKRTLENYRQTSLSLTSRGFNGELMVWSPHRHYLSTRYAVEAVLGCLFLSILVIFQQVKH